MQTSSNHNHRSAGGRLKAGGERKRLRLPPRASRLPGRKPPPTTSARIERMRIGINCRLLAPHSGGAKQYLFRLVNRLLQSARDECLLIHWRTNRAVLDEGLPANWRTHAVEIGTGRELNALLPQLDVYFCPFGLLEPRPAAVAAVVMLPDVQEAYLPQYFSKRERWSRLYHHAASTRIANRVVTLSSFSKECIARVYRVPREKIHVAYQAAADCGGNLGGPYSAPPPALPERFVLYPANLWAHKNHERLFAAMALARDRFGVTITCVLTGADVPGGYDARRGIVEYGLHTQVHRLGYQPEAVMPGIYRRATALVFPSLFEGFGLPLVEAMAAGCPIACARRASLPEVAGEAALYFDAESPEDMATALITLWTDDACRAALVREGQKRVARFSLDAMVAAHRDAFEGARRDFAEAAPRREPWLRRLSDLGASAWQTLHTRVPPAPPIGSWQP